MITLYTFLQEKTSENRNTLTDEELYIGQLLFHFQTGIQYNLHAVYQVNPNVKIKMTAQTQR